MTNIFRRPRAGLGRLALYLAVFVGAALALNGWIFSSGAIEWSQTLENPDWAPPGGVIGAVWTGLFALMAIAAFLADRLGEPGRRTPARLAIIGLWGVCLFWTFGYFGLQSVANGFYVTVAAFVLCIPTLYLAARAAPLAAVALTPLLGWLGFALALSWATFSLNA
ncbi:MAG: TspO/MBR family protein [Oceanicaulis sp.]